MHKHLGGIALIFGAFILVGSMIGWATSSDHLGTDNTSYTVYYKPNTYNNKKGLVSTSKPTYVASYYSVSN